MGLLTKIGEKLAGRNADRSEMRQRTNFFMEGADQPALAHYPHAQAWLFGRAALVTAYAFLLLDVLLSAVFLFWFITLPDSQKTDQWHTLIAPVVSLILACIVPLMIQHNIFRAGGGYETEQRMHTSTTMHGEARHTYGKPELGMVISRAFSQGTKICVGFTIGTNIGGWITWQWHGGDTTMLLLSLAQGLLFGIIVVLAGHLLSLAGWHMVGYGKKDKTRERTHHYELLGSGAKAEHRYNQLMDGIRTVEATPVRPALPASRKNRQNAVNFEDFETSKLDPDEGLFEPLQPKKKQI